MKVGYTLRKKLTDRYGQNFTSGKNPYNAMTAYVLRWSEAAVEKAGAADEAGVGEAEEADAGAVAVVGAAELSMTDPGGGETLGRT